MMRTLAWVTLLMLAVLAGAAAQEGAAVPAEDRRILVMFALAPPHYRPDSDYAGGYDARVAHDATRRIAAEVAHSYGLALSQDWPMPALGVDCYVMQVPEGESVEAKIRLLARDKRVESVQAMNTFRTLGHGDPLYSLQPSARLWHLGELHQVTTGRDVLIAQIDSGVDVDHPDLAGQVRHKENFVDGQDYAPEKHGTEVAGILVARADNGVGIAGIAPGASLLALRACWQREDAATLCNSFTLAKALQFALDRRAQIINLSLSGPPDRLLERLLDFAWQRGVTVVVACDPDVADGGFPASNPHVLAVGQLDASGSTGPPGADVWAPGRDVPTTQPGARWGFVTGSSFAAAHVSGLVALMLQLAPALGPADMPAALSTDLKRTDGATRASIGRIDPCAVISRLAPAWAGCNTAGVTAVVSLR